ncbi:MAG: amino acid ABC transporter substrate-binding protein [Clostridia bacterium]|nr:amino acid ABC transporter substrate-binding protein [Clostridia bacterium]
MKRILSCLLAVLMIAAVFAGCSSETSTETPNDPAQEATTFTVGFDAAFPPYGYMDDNGEYVGFDLDLAAEVAKRNNWELVLKPIDWNAKDMQLDSGAIDCIWNGFTINGREDSYTWSMPYVDNSQVIVVKSDSGIATLADLADKIVIVQTESSAEAALTSTEDNDENLALAATFKKLDSVPDYNTAFMKLESGAAQAIAMDVGVANYQVASRGTAFTILEETISEEQYGVGFKLGNTDLRDKVEATLNEMVADGTFTATAEKWGLTDSVCLGE